MKPAPEAVRRAMADRHEVTKASINTDLARRLEGYVLPQRGAVVWADPQRHQYIITMTLSITEEEAAKL